MPETKRIVVLCRSCDLVLDVPVSPVEQRDALLVAFFEEHADCDTAIDLSQSGPVDFRRSGEAEPPA